ncbi:MAG: phenylalanine--tRNA ligase subunit alpha, partial [Spirochaetaceae bacterium]|nr:phenylalanine--tRNA ligase subunit alpha [Spirochaetaceae bacterium]
MDTHALIKNLHPLEIRVLRTYGAKDELTSERLQKELDYKEGHANQAFSWLVGKELAAVVRREPHTYFEITDLGRSFAENGTNDERIISFLKDNGPHLLPEIAAALKIENKDVGSAFGQLSKEGVLAMDANKKAAYTGKPASDRIAVTASLLKKAAACENGLMDQTSLSKAELDCIGTLAKKRGAADAAFRIVERETVVYKLTADAENVKKALLDAGLTGEELGALTPKMIASGEWKNKAFRGYNIAVPPARIILGRTNPYVSFRESVTDTLVSIGFEEFDGPIVETEFWN